MLPFPLLNNSALIAAGWGPCRTHKLHYVSIAVKTCKHGLFAWIFAFDKPCIVVLVRSNVESTITCTQTAQILSVYVCVHAHW